MRPIRLGLATARFTGDMRPDMRDVPAEVYAIARNMQAGRDPFDGRRPRKAKPAGKPPRANEASLPKRKRRK